MKLLNGRELADFIKNRQLRAVTSLRLSHKTVPKLAIVQIKDDPVINTYVKLKKRYGDDIGVMVEPFRVSQTEARGLIEKLNKDESVHGIIVQLPIDDVSQTDEIVNLVDANKDVDALAKDSKFEPATPTAILWLLAGNGIDLANKKVVIIGKGKLVGQPLSGLLEQSGIDVVVADRKTKDLKKLALSADIIITATGNPVILLPDMVGHGAVVIDAGVASEDGKTVGDVSPLLYEREDLTITPQRGGVGPLTVTALFENVIISATRVAKKTEPNRA